MRKEVDHLGEQKKEGMIEENLKHGIIEQVEQLFWEGGGKMS
jgi:hypothetical protein